MKRATIAQFRLGWIPPENVRGNSRAHWGARSRGARQLLESGLAHGLELRQLTPDAYPMLGPLAIEYRVTARRKVDFDNLHVGYKHWLDGLQLELPGRKPRRAGAGIIEDDRQFVKSTIITREGNRDETIITITQAPPGWDDWETAGLPADPYDTGPSKTGRVAVPLEEGIGVHA